MMKKTTNLILGFVGLCGALLFTSTSVFADQTIMGRPIGHTLSLAQENKILATSTQVVTWDEFQSRIEVQKKALGSSWRFSTATVLDGYGMAIISIEQPSGTLETEFGKETELVFTIQPCTKIEAATQSNGVRCFDNAAPTPITQTQKIKLDGGESVLARFPHNVELSFSVIGDKP